ncbi:MAG: DNA gyrase subunit A [Dehalococcoidia bacterium]|nr:DNA gyrase subunit A [Dehalococcoidia bacterium]
MEIGTIRRVTLEDEVRNAYLDYAMSVIVSRALPDARDGLKPVQRRILYGMNELGSTHTSPYKKSARIVGEVMGKFHPHGDAPIYEAMVRMAQDFSMRYTLVDGQGNFGSMDNDPPAAMRYTEARLAEIAGEMLSEIDRDTVDFIPNFDSSLNEPTVLPSKLPALLLNGAAGIAVGMATNIPPHNLRELCDGIARLIDNPEVSVGELIELVRAPDFPTGGIILGREGIENAYATGRGKLVLRAKSHIEEIGKGRHQIVISELTYQTNKAALVERIAGLMKDKKIEGISEVRDESDREGIRVVIELKRDGRPTQVLNNLYKHTAMQSSFHVNMLALIDGQPRVINLKTALQQYVKFRREVITRRSRFDLKKAQERAHILEGLKVALDFLDEVIALIRGSRNAEAAREALMERFSLSQIQAQAILDMQLRRLAALERKKIEDEYAALLQTMAYLEDLLANPKKIDFLIKEEVGQIKEKYGDERRTEVSLEEAGDFKAEDLIPHQQTVVTLSNRGYIKRLPMDTYRTQHRGGKGVTGMKIRDTDDLQMLMVTDTHDNLLFFTNRGRVFQLKCYQLPESSRQAKGLPVINLIPIETDERVTEVMSTARFPEDGFIVMASRNGEVKKSELKRFSSVRSAGIIAMDIEKDDELISVKTATAQDDVILVADSGQSIRFTVDKLRTASRTSGGVRGINLKRGDKVVSMGVILPKTFLLTVTANGYGKRTPVEEYRLQLRGGGGMRAHHVNEKTGLVVDAAIVDLSHQLMVTTKNGTIIRMPLKGISRLGRDTQGVKTIRLTHGDAVASIAVISEPTIDPTPPVLTNGDSPEITAG